MFFQKKLNFLILFFFMVTQGFAQELISNRSFERKKDYPRSYGQIDLVYDWQGGSTGKWSMPNYFYAHTYDCPKALGKQEARSGNAYMGVGFALRKKRYKGSQYIQARLRFPLEKDTVYVITVYVSPADKFQTAIDYFPAAFSAESMLPYNLRPAQRNNVQLRSEHQYLDSTRTWTKVTTTYKATGDELFFMMGGVEEGKLYIPFSLKKMPFKWWSLAYLVSKNMTYYFIDDVSIHKDGLVPSSGPPQAAPENTDEFEQKRN